MCLGCACAGATQDMRRAEGHTLLLLSAADDCENLTSALRLARLRCAVWRHLELGLGLG